MQSILQWNVRGYRSNYEYIQVTIKDIQPGVMCLQETFHGIQVLRGPSGYRAYFDSGPRAVAGTGLATLVRHDVPSYAVPINSPIATIAIRVRTNMEHTICNAYANPEPRLNANELRDLVAQLPTPYLLLGDLNSRSRAWGDTQENYNGRILEQFLINNDTAIFNIDLATHVTLHTGSTSCVDVSLCSPDVFGEFQWSVWQEIFGSDHYPMILTEMMDVAPAREPRYIIKRANWQLFTAMSSMVGHREDQLEMMKC